MKKTVIILSILALVVTGYGQAKSEMDITENYTVEDTVRYQIGGKLYSLNFHPSDSITVIKTFYHQFSENDKEYYGFPAYREYHFIVHNRYSYAHQYFETSTLDKQYNSSREYFRDEYKRLIKQLDSIQSKHIDFSIKDFNGYWIYLKEHNGNYYLDDKWSWHSSFYIADSIFTNHYMDGLYPEKILEAVSIQGNGISILLDGYKEPIKIEVFDKAKSIYRISFDGERVYYIAPTRAIHNFEIIQYTNNTGDLI
jgi:hypothetical protein